MLKAAGADHLAYNMQLQRPDLIASSNSQHAVVRVFHPFHSDMEFTDAACKATERLKAAASGNVAALGRAEDAGKVTALMVACRYGQRGVVEALLPTTEVLDAQSATGCTALYLAAEEGDDHIVRLLLGRGASVAPAAEDGSTCLFQACKVGKEQAVLLLLEAKASIEARLKNGRTSLMVSAENGHEQVSIRYLQVLINTKSTCARAGMDTFIR